MNKKGSDENTEEPIPSNFYSIWMDKIQKN